jgi:hypothetical protein
VDISAERIIQLNPSITWRKYLKGVVVEPGIALNESATEVFLRIDGKRSVGDITRELTSVFEIDHETCLADTVALIADLADQGIVDILDAVDVAEPRIADVGG